MANISKKLSYLDTSYATEFIYNDTDSKNVSGSLSVTKVNSSAKVVPEEKKQSPISMHNRNSNSDLKHERRKVALKRATNNLKAIHEGCEVETN